jgi:hypothetical protein
MLVPCGDGRDPVFREPADQRGQFGLLGKKRLAFVRQRDREPAAAHNAGNVHVVLAEVVAALLARRVL